MSFEDEEYQSRYEAWLEDQPPFISCFISVIKDGQQLFYLDMGVTSVIDFAERVDKEGFPGALQIKRSFNFNVDVFLYGKDLLLFMEEKYPREYEAAKELIQPEEIYMIYCCDLS